MASKETAEAKTQAAAPSLDLVALMDESAPLPDPDLLSPKSATIVKLTARLRAKDQELKETNVKLAKTKRQEKSLRVKTRSEEFQIATLRKQVENAKDVADKAIDDKKKAVEKQSKQKQEFQKKYNTLYKTQEANYKDKVDDQGQQATSFQQLQTE